jgi:hypothetical protein
MATKRKIKNKIDEYGENGQEGDSDEKRNQEEIS